VLALALVVPGWLSALIGGGALLLVAGVREDVDAVKQGVHS